MKIQLYTFENFPALDQLLAFDDTTVVLKKLKKDLGEVYKSVSLRNSDLVIGIAKNDGISHWERWAVNTYNGDKKVLQDAVLEKFRLYVPQETNFQINYQPATAFCNYTSFHLAHQFYQQGVEVAFCHVNVKDMTQLLNEIGRLKLV